MATLKVNNKLRRVQYTAGVAATNFVYDWEIFADGDLDVYKDEVLLTLTIDYTVTGANTEGGGDVVLVVPTVGGEQIVILGDLAIDQTTDYTFNANFTGETIQTQFNRLTMIDQELDTIQKELGLLYNPFNTLRAGSADNTIPQLGAGQFWKMNDAGTGITAVTIVENPNCSTLRSELASDQSGSDGARIVGYFSGVSGGTTVKAALDTSEQILPSLASQVNGSDGALLVGYFDSSDSTGKTVGAKLDALTTGAAVNFTNLCFGGDFNNNPFQRGSTFGPPLATNTFIADRFRYQQVGTQSLSSSAPTTGNPPIALTGVLSERHLELAVTTPPTITPTDFSHFVYGMEGFDWARIAQRIFTVSFYVKATVTGIYTLFLQNEDSTISFVSEYTINSSLTWEKKSVTVSASPSAGTWNYITGRGVRVGWTLMAGANLQTATLDSWQTANVTSSINQVNGIGTAADIFAVEKIQIEEGSIASSFFVRPVEQTISLLQRYFVKTYDMGLPPGTITLGGAFEKIAQDPKNSPLVKDWKFPVTMSDALVIATFNPSTGAQGTWANLTSPSSPAITAQVSAGETGVNIISAATTPPLTGSGYFIHATADAEIT